jgi:hypothetical protein
VALDQQLIPQNAQHLPRGARLLGLGCDPAGGDRHAEPLDGVVGDPVHGAEARSIIRSRVRRRKEGGLSSRVTMMGEKRSGTECDRPPQEEQQRSVTPRRWSGVPWGLLASSPG